MAFFGFSRVRELTGVAIIIQIIQFRFQDIEPFPKQGKLEILLKHSKTDQEGKGEIIIIENNKFHASTRPFSIT